MKHIKILTSLSALLLVTSVLSGCASEEIDNSVLLEETPPQQVTQKAVVKTEPQTPPVVEEKPLPWKGKKIQYENGMGLTIADNVIYNMEEKIGSISNGRMHFNFQGHTYSFQMTSGPEKLNFNSLGDNFFVDKVYYDGLTINFPDTSRREVVSYRCNGPLVSGQLSFGCTTDEKSMLKQYEFGKEYRQFSTGADVSLNWKKVILKKVGEKDIVFEGKLEGATISSYPEFVPMEAFLVYKSLRADNATPDLGINMKLSYENQSDPAYKNDYEKMVQKLEPLQSQMRKIVSSQSYAEQIIKNSANQKLEKNWDKIIESFEIEK